MYNIMTIDLEEWFHANYHEDVFNTKKNYEVRVLDNTYRLLAHFNENNVKATFFVLGYIAIKHRQLILDIQNAGHEIASHGTSHSLVYEQSKKEFKEDIYKSKILLEDIVCKPIKGYRAPSWSITNKSLWALEVLQELGFIYDSSIFPFENFLYGIKDAPRFIYKPSINNKEGLLYEIPPSTYNIFGKTIGFSGGFFLRAIPYPIIKKFTEKINNLEQKPVIFYLHPREIDKNQPRLKLKYFEYLIHYLNISSCEKKFSKIVDSIKLTSIEEFYDL